jgi:hypothetical protein
MKLEANRGEPSPFSNDEWTEASGKLFCHQKATSHKVLSRLPPHPANIVHDCGYPVVHQRLAIHHYSQLVRNLALHSNGT